MKSRYLKVYDARCIDAWVNLVDEMESEKINGNIDHSWIDFQCLVKFCLNFYKIDIKAAC